MAGELAYGGADPPEADKRLPGWASTIIGTMDAGILECRTSGRMEKAIRILRLLSVSFGEVFEKS
jgi:hypothetical protein